MSCMVLKKLILSYIINNNNQWNTLNNKYELNQFDLNINLIIMVLSLEVIITMP